MSSFFDLVASLQSSVDDLDSIISGGDTETVDVNGVNKNTISKAIKDKFTELLVGQRSGVIVFTTYALLDAYTPTAEQKTASFKVSNDANTSLNGYYHWVSGTTYEKDADLVNGVVESSNADATSGGTVFDTIENITTLQTGKNIYSSAFNVTGFYITTSFNLSSAATSIYAKIPVIAGQDYVIVRGQSVPNGFNGFYVEDVSGTQIQTGLFQDLPADTTGNGVTITTAANAAFLFINIFSEVAGGFNNITPTLQIEKGLTATSYEPFDQVATQVNQFDIFDVLAQQRLDAVVDFSTLVTGKNIYPPSTNLTGFYVGTSWGLSADAGGIYATFPIKPSTSYVINQGQTVSNSFRAFYITDLSGAQVQQEKLQLLDIGDNGVGRKLTTVASAAFISINIESTVASGMPNISSTLQIEEGSNGTTYEPYIEYLNKISGYDLQDADIKQRLDQANDNTNKRARNIAILGDSISAGSNGLSWVNVLEDNLMFNELTNVSKSGARWSHQAGTVYDLTLGAGNNVMWNQANVIINDVTNATIVEPDVFLIMAGRNDDNQPLGDVATIFTGDILSEPPGNILDIIEGVRYTCETILTEYPSAEIILVTPIQWFGGASTAWYDMGTSITQAGKRLSTKVIDAGAESGIYNYFDTYTVHRYLLDGTHPNADGVAKLGNYLKWELQERLDYLVVSI